MKLTLQLVVVVLKVSCYFMEGEFDKLSRNFVRALRTTENHCRVSRVSFIDFYLFSIFYKLKDRIFTPYKHCNLLESYCGPNTEPGLSYNRNS